MAAVKEQIETRPELQGGGVRFPSRNRSVWLQSGAKSRGLGGGGGRS